MADWYCKFAEQVLGPFSPGQLKALATGGRLMPGDLVARSGEGPWVPASRVKGLFDLAAGDDLDTPPTPPKLPSEQPTVVTEQLPGTLPPGLPPQPQPPLPQPPVVLPGKAASHPTSSQPSVAQPVDVTPMATAAAAPGGFAIQTDELTTTGRRQKTRRPKKPRQPLTRKEKNARLVKRLTAAVVLAVAVFASVPFLRQFVHSSTPAPAPPHPPMSVASDVDLAAAGGALGDPFPGPAPASAPAPSQAAAPAGAQGRSPAGTVATPDAAPGVVEAAPIRVIVDRPTMSGADGRTLRTSNRFLLVELELKTTRPDASVRFRGWATAVDEISLTDPAGVKYAPKSPKNFSGMFVDGQCRQMIFLSADKPTTDVVVFSWPDDAPQLPST
ncbi:MAG: DUF4339 domain-containing protein, partial [Thermoguttaceae bacterium]